MTFELMELGEIDCTDDVDHRELARLGRYQGETQCFSLDLARENVHSGILLAVVNTDDRTPTRRAKLLMHCVQDSIKLTSSGGTVLEVEPGETISLPKGWKGRWTTSGYTKYYVT